MLKLNSELRAASRTTLSGNWTIAALVTLLYLLIAGGVSSIPKVGTVVSLIITYPLTYGLPYCSSACSAKEPRLILVNCLMDSRTSEESGVRVF